MGLAATDCDRLWRRGLTADGVNALNERCLAARAEGSASVVRTLAGLSVKTSGRKSLGG